MLGLGHSGQAIKLTFSISILNSLSPTVASSDSPPADSRAPKMHRNLVTCRNSSPRDFSWSAARNVDGDFASNSEVRSQS